MKNFLPKTSNNTQACTERSQSGFTLIELMVVITIIAILAAIGYSSYVNVQKSARDARRKGDIDAIANAMEVNYGKTTPGQYNALAGSMFSSGSVPLDPINTTASTRDDACPTVCKYCYWEGTSAQSAGTCANASNKLTASAGMTGTTNIYWYVCANLEAGTPNYYCKGNQQ